MRIFFDTPPVTIARPSADLVTGWTPSVQGGSAALILPRKTYTQPQGTVEIDWSSPLTKGLESATLPDNTIATKYGRASTIYTFTKSSSSLKVGTVVSGIYRIPNAPTIDNIGYFGLSKLTQTWPSDIESLYEISRGTGGSRALQLSHNSSDLPVIGTIPAVDSYTHRAIVYNCSVSDASANLYVDAVLSSNFIKSGTFPWDAQDIIQFRTGNSSLGIYATYLYVWSRNLSIDELSSLKNNPWQIFKQQPTRISFKSPDAPLYSLINETVADDADYISANEPSTCDIALSSVTDPGTSSGQVLTIRAKSDNDNTLVATLKQDTTLIPAVPGGSTSLILPRKTYTQPQGAVSIDRSNPFAKSTLWLANKNETLGLELNNGGFIGAGSLYRKMVGSSIGWNNPSGVNSNKSATYSGKLFSTVSPYWFSGFGKKAIGVYVIPHDTALGIIFTGSIDHSFRIEKSAAGWGGAIGNNEVWTGSNFTTAGTVQPGVPALVLITQDINKRTAIHAVDGTGYHTGTSVAATSNYMTVYQNTFIGNYSGSGYGMGATLLGLYAFEEIPSPIELINLYQNPWQIFKQQPTRIPFTAPDIPASGGTTTIATRTITGLISSYKDYPIALTSGECDSITDYSALHVELEARE